MSRTFRSAPFAQNRLLMAAARGLLFNVLSFYRESDETSQIFRELFYLIWDLMQTELLACNGKIDCCKIVPLY